MGVMSVTGEERNQLLYTKTIRLFSKLNKEVPFSPQSNKIMPKMNRIRCLNK